MPYGVVFRNIGDILQEEITSPHLNLVPIVFKLLEVGTKTYQ